MSLRQAQAERKDIGSAAAQQARNARALAGLVVTATTQGEDVKSFDYPRQNREKQA
jgi:hypothetical protein